MSTLRTDRLDIQRDAAELYRGWNRLAVATHKVFEP